MAQPLREADSFWFGHFSKTGASWKLLAGAIRECGNDPSLVVSFQGIPGFIPSFPSYRANLWFSSPKGPGGFPGAFFELAFEGIGQSTLTSATSTAHFSTPPANPGALGRWWRGKPHLPPRARGSNPWLQRPPCKKSRPLTSWGA